MVRVERLCQRRPSCRPDPRLVAIAVSVWIALDGSQVLAQAVVQRSTFSTSDSPGEVKGADADSTRQQDKTGRRRFLGWLERTPVQNTTRRSKSSLPEGIPPALDLPSSVTTGASLRNGSGAVTHPAIEASPVGPQGERSEPRPKTDDQITRAQDPQPSPETRTAEVGGRAAEPFLRRLFDALFEEEPTGQGEAAQPRRLPPAPYQSPPFPFAEHLGPIVGIRDDAVWPLMEALEDGPNGQFWKDNRIKIYGWADPSITFGTSRNSNIPQVYNIVPNSLQMSQVILIFERMTDSNQTDQMDWGFKVTNLYGMDYRYTTAKGWFSDQLLKHNHLYGYDPLQLYMDLYFPHILDGMILRVGRYISPIDIEAQLSPENYLYSHSVMYSVDPYTFTGIQGIFRISDRWFFMSAIHAGNDMAPWTTSSQPNGEFLVKWVSPNNKDVLFGGVDSIGKGQYKNGHDDLQVSSILWEHKFNDKFHNIAEMYYIWQRNALAGGTVIDGPPHPFFPSVGPGKFIPGLSDSLGFVNYTAYKVSDKDRLVLRSDILADFQGQRLGFKTTYFEHTLGWAHFFYDWLVFRPEVRFDYTSGAKAIDNGTKREMFTFSADMIVRF
jgi:hypothetical protein